MKGVLKNGSIKVHYEFKGSHKDEEGNEKDPDK